MNAIYISKVASLVSGRRPAPHLGGCGIAFRLARVASPYQRWLAFFAGYRGGTFRFDRTLHGHSRTAKPSSNARVDSSGGLTLTSQKLFLPCPAGPVGTRIQSVEAVGQRRRLKLDSTTRLAATRQAYTVAIRNDGGLAIRGVIASLEFAAVAKPHNSWWRSKPVTIARLAPGATVTVRFAPPALGRGLRLIRATSAAIECETRVSDNSPVFRVRAA